MTWPDPLDPVSPDEVMAHHAQLVLRQLDAHDAVNFRVTMGRGTETLAMGFALSNAIIPLIPQWHTHHA
jgi:hypothetical protein